MYAAIFTVIAPIILTAGVGFFWSQMKLRYDGHFVSSLVMNIASPCLILATMAKAQLSHEHLWQLSAITLSGLLIFFLLHSVLIRYFKDSLRSFLNPLVFANTGNMGVPICLFAFGEQALAFALVIFMVTSIVHFSVGVSLVGGAHPLKTLLKAPVFYAAVASFFILLYGFELPKGLFNTLDLIGGMAIPLMLFSLGVSLHSLKLQTLGKSTVYALARLVLGFAVGLLLCELFQLQGVLRGVVLIQSAMPSAVFNYLLASTYKREEQAVAAIVVMSTVLSFLTLPLLLWYVM
jgi:hypothetical protein